ncbi:MAG TPA: MbnP family protein [Dinghuibacter sp.]|uniref:MbnP family protein n=1 Tax=Dinghuibacter sp. TaxID=2024697 RepID=UPI002B937BD4|nr:MbnP family protein [Dinghuibacter sp.]HTJ10764.1 MbnP family protein [Dinghuibacter sp.]
MRHLLTGLIILSIATCWSLSSCKKELSATGSPTTIQLWFNNVAGIAPLTRGTIYQDSYTGEQFSVGAFKYYISNVQLISSSGVFTNIPSVYRLVDAFDTTTTSVSFPGVADSLVAISFLIGVDSTVDASGPRNGDLDPSKGMFLGGNQGYIMAELTGYSPASSQVNFSFNYQISGYTGPYNVLRKVTLALPGLPVTVSPVIPDTVQIRIDTDVQTWFSAVHYLPISGNSTCTAPGQLASEYADNYAHMFVVRNVIIK